MTIDDYFSALERGLGHNVKLGTPDQPIICLASDAYNGLVRCRISFWDESYLDLYEVVSTELGYPVKVHYAYCIVNAKNADFPQCYPRKLRRDQALHVYSRGQACLSLR